MLGTDGWEKLRAYMVDPSVQWTTDKGDAVDVAKCMIHWQTGTSGHFSPSVSLSRAGLSVGTQRARGESD